MASDKLNILVVDDKKIIGDLFDFTLGYSGHSITVVDNARAAYEAVKGRNFDIAFVDIVMPECDGVDVLKELKHLSPQLPVVMMSGYSVEDKKKEAGELGAVACLKKPFEIDEVKSLITTILNKDV